MAKFTKGFSAKGTLTFSDLTMTEIKKDEINVVNLGEILKHFDGNDVSISIKYEENYGESDT